MVGSHTMSTLNIAALGKYAEQSTSLAQVKVGREFPSPFEPFGSPEPDPVAT